jgi:hypothetical protein
MSRKRKRQDLLNNKEEIDQKLNITSIMHQLQHVQMTLSHDDFILLLHSIDNSIQNSNYIKSNNKQIHNYN